MFKYNFSQNRANGRNTSLTHSDTAGSWPTMVDGSEALLAWSFEKLGHGIHLRWKVSAFRWTFVDEFGSLRWEQLDFNIAMRN